MSRKKLLGRGLKVFFACVGVAVVTIVGSEAKTENITLLRSQLSDLMAKVQGYIYPVSETSWSSPMGQGDDAVVASADHTMSLKLPAGDPIEPLASDSCMDAKVLSGIAVSGDRLQIRFFEKAAFAPPSDAGASPQNDIVFERLDLSGAYEVGEDGMVSLPFVGRLEVGGRSLGCIESIVTQASVAATRSQITANASFAARPPVLVKGAVRSPGAYQFSPGMTVETLLALAGEPGKSGLDYAQQRIKLLARQREIDRSALSVRIEWHRLKATLAGQRELRLSGDDRLRAGAALGFSRITSETEALEAELDAIETLDAANQSELADLDEQIAAHEKYIAMVDGQYAHHSQLLGKLRELHAKRIASMRQREQVEMNIVNVVQAKVSVEQYLTELRAKRNAVLHGAKVEAAKRRERLTRQIRDLAEENDMLDAQHATVDAELTALDAGNPEDRVGPAVAVSISRRFSDGVRRVEATPETRLTPSDLVTVSLVFPTQSHPSLSRLDQIDNPLTEMTAK